MKNIHSCLAFTLTAALAWSALPLRADEPRVNAADAQTSDVRAAVPVTNTNPAAGLYGDVILDGDASFPGAGVVLRAGSRPDVVARTGSAAANTGFVVFNSNNAELLRVTSSGRVGIGNASPQEALTIGSGTTQSDVSLRSASQNALHLGTFNNNIALTINRRVADGGFAKTGFPTASMVFETLPANSAIVLRTANTNDAMDKERLRIDKDGKVTIGHPADSPDASLLVRGGSTAAQILAANSSGFGIVFRDLTAYEPFGSGVVMDMQGNSMIRVSNLEVGWGGNAQITSQGTPLRLNWRAPQDVEIGDTGYASKLVVKGNGTSSFAGAVTINADLNVGGTITATKVLNAVWQDIAEWVVSDEPLSAGTVVVVDPAKNDQVVASTRAYDTRVAGVVSPQPGIVLGRAAPDKVQIATTGRVRVKVDATSAPIARGDLLVSSDRPGVAMKSIAVTVSGIEFHRPGTLIGKALEPLERGEGEILVLLSLQ
jgi:hypothetical protein